MFEVVVYTVYICHTEGSIKLRERKQRTSGAEVNLFITRNIHQLAFTRYAFFSSVFESMYPGRTQLMTFQTVGRAIMNYHLLGVKLGLWNE